MSKEALSEDERSAPFKLEVAKRRRAYEYARSKLKEAQQALDAAEREYGETHRALQALGYDD